MSALTYWKMDRDADGVVSLTLDKPGTSANVLSSEVLVELGALLGGLAVAPPRALIVRSAKPSGFVAGLYAATDLNAGVWKAPAGITTPLAGTAESAPGLTEADVDGLVVHAVNCIRFFPTIGTVVWGARTLAGGEPSATTTGSQVTRAAR